jgi:hypothetical protein
VEEGQTTATRSVERYRAEFASAHPGWVPVAVPCKDVLTLATMDLLNAMHSATDEALAARRIPLVNSIRDVDAGRWLEREHTGHVFFNTDTSVGIEATSGFESFKGGICLGAQVLGADS